MTDEHGVVIAARPAAGAGVIESPRPGYADVHAVIDARAVWTAFQPVVRLDTREVVAYEALNRGPAGTPWQAPGRLFDDARAAGRVGELDWVCRMSAFRAALDARLHPDLALFVNVEPAALREPCPPDLIRISEGAHRLRVVTELTERAVGDDPAALLAASGGCRDAAWGVALDDVGAVPASLALMPFVHPDFVKLDMHLLHHSDGPHVARVVNAVIAHAERTGATIIAEGIETAQHLAVARTMGATLGQGWLFGHPGPLGRTPTGPRSPLRLLPAPANRPHQTPFELVSAHRPVNRATKRMLLGTTRFLEAQALAAGESPVLLACFQDSRQFTAATARRYDELVGRSAFVAAYGHGRPAREVPGVRWAELAASDPLCGEWNVIVVGPHFSAALVARDLGDRGAEHYRRFDYALTYDRELVVEAASALLRRLTGQVLR